MLSRGRWASRQAPVNRFAFADPYEAEVLSRPSAVARFGSAVSEFTAEFGGRHYQCVPSGFGQGIGLSGVDQLDDVIRRYGRTLAHLGIFQAIGRDNVLDINRLAPLSRLRSLSLGYVLKCLDIPATSQLPSLAYLRLGNPVDQPFSVDGLIALRGFDGEDSPLIERVERAAGLQVLKLSGFVGADFVDRPLPPRVRRVEITNSRHLKRLSGIDRCPDLTYLQLANNSRLSDISNLADARRLTHLLIENCPRITNIDFAMKHPALRYLDVRDCTGIQSVAPVADLSPLTHLFFTGRTKLDRPLETLIGAAADLQFYWASQTIDD